ncbi:hypothetical protein [Lacrimispora brassicae]
MSGNKPMHISLTGEKSHKVNIPTGQGSFSIGTKGISKGKYDVWVEKDSLINWDAFAEYLPYGDWPRFFYYSGNDKGFIDWSSKRPIEDFHWWPQENASVDLTKANINKIFIHTEKNKIEVSTGDKIRLLSLSGNLKNIDIKKCTTIPYLYFSPLCSQAETRLCQLPVYKALEKAASVDINSSPMGMAFDCKSLLQFQNLTSLNLTGNLANLESLTELKHLERIGLRFVPNLTNMPKLMNWKNLKSFIGWNIEETAGKVLKAELNELLKEKELDYSSVSKLRKTIWFTTEYGIPFSGWEDKNAKIATKAYKACLKEIKKSKTESEVHEAIIRFIEVINQLTDIETSEREDAGTAVSQLIESSVLGISQKTGKKWFDEIRDF